MEADCIPFVPRPRGHRPRRKRILVVDANAVVGAVMTELLESLGYEASACTSANEALRCCHRGQVDAVLTEVAIRTPEGRILADQIARWHPTLPIAVLTGWPDHPETREAAEHGVRMVLSKPIRARDLDLALRALLSGFQRR